MVWVLRAVAALSLVLSPVSTVFAAEIEVAAAATKSQVSSGEVVNFSVTISGPLEEPPRVEIGKFDGFSVVGTQQARQVRVVKGKKVQTVALVYGLLAGEPGDRTIGPVKVAYKEKSYETKPVRIKVVPGKPKLQGGMVL